MKPEKIDRYEIKSEVGRGGMASVYEAYDPRFERIVAVKVLPREFMHDPEFRARFTREAKVIASLEHPAIVPVYDFGEDNGQPFLVMRLMRGGSLTDRLMQGPIPFDETAVILKRLGSALDRAHSQGVVHRDLKPSNVLFDEYGDAYLADFGIVRVATANDALTASGSLIGTPTYMSPEQVYGDKELDGRSDIYALGVILFQMLTGSTPYEADTPARMMMKHVMEPVPQIKNVRPDLPDEYEAVITKAMAKEREERFPTAAELSSAVTKITQKSSKDDLAAELEAIQADLLDDQPGTSDLPTTEIESTDVVATYPPSPDTSDSDILEALPESETAVSDSDSTSIYYEAAPHVEDPRAQKLRIPIWVWATIALLVITCIVGISGIAWFVRQENNPFASGSRNETATAAAFAAEATAAEATSLAVAPAETDTPTATETAVPTDTAVPPTEPPTPTQTVINDADATRASLELTRAALVDVTPTTASPTTTDVESTRASLEETRAATAIETVAAPRFTPQFGPDEGSLAHALDNIIKSVYADLTLQDFYMETTFANPYGSEVGGWDIGLTFRQTEINNEFRIVIRSDGSWSLNNRDGDEDIFIQEGDINHLINLDENGTNHLEVIAIGETGYFFLNGGFGATLDLSSRLEEGDLAIGTGFYASDMQEGASTQYRRFAVWPLTPAYGPEDGSMEHIGDELIKADFADIETADFISRASFTNPYLADEDTGWDYGFSFRDLGVADQYWLVITSDEDWALDHQTEEDDFYLLEDDLDNLNIGAGESNEIILIAQNDVGYFFLNGQFIAELDLSDRLESGEIAIITAFYIGDERVGSSTVYEAWTIWELP